MKNLLEVFRMARFPVEWGALILLGVVAALVMTAEWLNKEDDSDG